MEIPIPPDALCGGPPLLRGRRNPGYSEPLAQRSENPVSHNDIPLGDRTGAIAERASLPSRSEQVAFHHPPSAFRRAVTEDRNNMTPQVYPCPPMERQHRIGYPNAVEPRMDTASDWVQIPPAISPRKMEPRCGPTSAVQG